MESQGVGHTEQLTYTYTHTHTHTHVGLIHSNALQVLQIRLNISVEMHRSPDYVVKCIICTLTSLYL